MTEYDIYSKYSDWQARANCVVLIRRREKKASYLDRQAHANSEDPDQTSTEYDISSKNRQLRAISVDPGKTPTVYPICSK